MSDVSQIDGSAVKLRREAQGWAINDLAARACLSVKQVRQIEEGGLSSFYSESVKLTAARKVAGLLQLSEAQLFGQMPSPPPQAEEESLLFAAHYAGLTEHRPETPATADHPPAQTQASGVQLMRSEPLHFLAQPPEHEELDVAPVPEVLQAQTVPTEAIQGITPHTVSHQPSQAEEAETAPSGNYFLKILVLFLVAIAVAALLRPKSVENNIPAGEANTGQNMTAPPVAVSPEPNNAAPTAATGETAVTDRYAKPAAMSEPSSTTAPVNTLPATAASPATAPATAAPSAANER